MTVMTRWHRLRDAADRGAACLAVDEKVARAFEDLPKGAFDRRAFDAFLDEAEGVPRFVVPPQLAEMAMTAPAMRSLSDMYVCGVAALPYPACVVEFEAGADRFHVHLAEGVDAAGNRSWHGVPVSSYPEEGREMAMAFPVAFDFRLAAEGDPDDPDVRFGYTARLPPYLAPGPAAEGYAAAVSGLAFRRVAAGFLCALLLLNTIGLEREEVALPRALNRARGKARRPIPGHTVIRLARYATAAGPERPFDERAPVEVHLRRAHKRRVPVGEGRTGRRWHLFPAQVVGYLPDGRKPSMAELIASRAARPYVVRPATDARAPA